MTICYYSSSIGVYFLELKEPLILNSIPEKGTKQCCEAAPCPPQAVREQRQILTLGVAFENPGLSPWWVLSGTHLYNALCGVS